MQFSLRDLWIAVTLIVFGAAFANAARECGDHNGVYGTLCCLSSLLIGVGVFYPFKRPWLGSVMAVWVQLFIGAYTLH